MIPARILTALSTADPGSDAFLSAVEWLCDCELWRLCDKLLTERERAVAAEQARLAVVRASGVGGYHGTAIPWAGPQEPERRDAA